MAGGRADYRAARVGGRVADGVKMNVYTIPATMAEFAADLRDMEITDPVAYAQLRPIYEQMLVGARGGSAAVVIERPE